MQSTSIHHLLLRAGLVVCCVVQLLASSACTLGGDIDDVGESCVSDLDCAEDKECVPADSSNASRACMPIAG